jgi:anti-anti-sigma factor
MEFRTSTYTVGGRPVVAVEGVVDLVAVPLVRDLFQRLLREHPGATLVIDLDGVTAFDDCGLGVLVGAAATARERGGDVELVCTSGPVRERLALTRLDQLFTVRETAA